MENERDAADSSKDADLRQAGGAARTNSCFLRKRAVSPGPRTAAGNEKARQSKVRRA